MKLNEVMNALVKLMGKLIKITNHKAQIKSEAKVVAKLFLCYTCMII